MDAHYGAIRQDGTRKPLFGAFQTYATRGDALGTEACGDFEAPQISIAQPTDGAVFAGPLPLEASATDSSGVPRISFFVDGSDAEIRNFTDKDAPSKLRGAIEWQGAKKLAMGEHTITVVALDPMGNQSSKSVKVTRVDASKLPAIKTQLKLKVRGKGGKRTLYVQVKPASRGLTNVLGKIKIVCQKKVKGHWKTAHKYGAMAKGYDRKSKRFKLKLKRSQWRVLVTYSGSNGYAKAASSVKFKVR